MLRRVRLAPVAVLAASSVLFTGCPDPTASQDGAASTDQPMSMQPSKDGPAPGGDPSAVGGGPAGQPGMQPGPGQAPPGGGRPKAKGFEVTPGQGVKISGSIAYKGTKTGTICVDFLKQGKDNDFPELVDSITLDKMGPFEVEAPKDFGDVWIVSFIDANGNGPDAGEPAARVKDAVKIGSENISNITLELSDSPDLGKLTPGGDVPPGGAAAGKSAPGAGAPGAAPGADGAAMNPPPGGAGAPPAGAGAPPAGAAGKDGAAAAPGPDAGKAPPPTAGGK
jgi:hypothetical protein